MKRIRLDEYLAGCSQDGGHVQHDVPVVVARRRLPIPWSLRRSATTTDRRKEPSTASHGLLDETTNPIDR